MKTFSLTEMRKDIFKLVSDVINKHEPLRISYKNDTVVVLNESDYDGLLETLAILSDGRNMDKIKKSQKEFEDGNFVSFNSMQK